MKNHWKNDSPNKHSQIKKNKTFGNPKSRTKQVCLTRLIKRRCDKIPKLQCDIIRVDVMFTLYYKDKTNPPGNRSEHFIS